MKKKFLLLTLIMCLLGGINSLSLKAQEVVIDGTVGGYDQTDHYLPPFDTYSKYTTSQIIYSAEEINMPQGGVISQIGFYIKSTTEMCTRDIKIYMRDMGEENDADDFGQNNYKFNKMEDEELVYDGSLSIGVLSDQWVNIDLDTDFTYTGYSILLCVFDETGVENKETRFYTYQTTSNNTYKALYKVGGTKYDPTTTSDVTFSSSKYIPFIKFTFTESEPETPTAPTLISPADKAIDINNPTLQFTLSDNTTQYRILLDKDEDLVANEDSDAVEKDWTDGNGEVSYQTSNLEAGATYYWKVIAKNGEGEVASGVYYFTTLAPPTAPTLVSPNETTVDINKPTLEFTLSDNTTQYQILLDENENPTKVEKNWTTGKGDVSYQTSKLDAGATYYWKVIAKNDAGEVESGIYQFTTANILRVIDYEIKLDENNITLKWQYADQNANKYQVYFGKPEEDIVIWNNPEWVPRETVEGKLVDDGSFTITKDADFGDKVYFRVDVSDGEETVEGATVFCVILDKNTDWGNSYNNADYVFVRADVRVTTENITAKNITIENGGILKTIMNNVVVSANTLVVNEGGQFFATDIKEYFPINTVKFNKKIVNPEGEWNGANNKTGWQFISSPFTDAPISSFIPEEGEGDYDLYKYDGSAEKPWVNHKDSELAEPFAPGEKFAPGIGYLASYETKDNLTFTRSNGSINRTNTFNIGSDGMMETPGIYLLGNPFLFNMDWVKISTNGAYGINATSFVVVKADGAYEYKTSGEIKVGEGFFVLTTDAWAAFNCTFAANDIVAASSSKSRNAGQSKSLNIIATGNAGNDNVVVNFNGEGEGFPKLQNFNDDIATVYVQNNDANYGVYNCDENTTEVELCFNANQMGNYTISVEPTGEFSNIVLVDRITGIETNLLVDDYHFTAMSEENNNRFFIRLGNGQQTTDNSHFVFQSGEELIIEAEGTVQIIDMMGRVVYTSNVENNNRINVSDFNNGAYVVRVINESEIKVEKVVIY